MPRSRERAKEISAVKSHVRLSSVQAHQLVVQLCLLHQALQSLRQRRVCPNLIRAFGTRSLVVTNSREAAPRSRAWFPYRSPTSARLSLSTVSHVHMLAVSISATCQGVRERRGLQQVQWRCGPIPRGLPLGEAPVSLLIVTQSCR